MAFLGSKGTEAAIATYFSGAVSGLNTVYSGEPRFVPGAAYFTGVSAVKSGAVGWPYIEAQHDKRIAFTGGPKPSGQQAKLVIYEAAFSIRFISHQAKGEDAQADHRQLVDNLVQLIRADRSFGGVFWQAGEGDTNMGDDIHVVNGPGPKQRKQEGPIHIWSMVRFIVVESI